VLYYPYGVAEVYIWRHHSLRGAELCVCLHVLMEVPQSLWVLNCMLDTMLFCKSVNRVFVSLTNDYTASLAIGVLSGDDSLHILWEG
jgi:hypothetical protein